MIKIGEPLLILIFREILARLKNNSSRYRSPKICKPARCEMVVISVYLFLYTAFCDCLFLTATALITALIQHWLAIKILEQCHFQCHWIATRNLHGYCNLNLSCETITALIQHWLAIKILEQCHFQSHWSDTGNHHGYCSLNLSCETVTALIQHWLAIKILEQFASNLIELLLEISMVIVISNFLVKLLLTYPALAGNHDSRTILLPISLNCYWKFPWLHSFFYKKSWFRVEAHTS